MLSGFVTHQAHFFSFKIMVWDYGIEVIIYFWRNQIKITVPSNL